ncbi:MAG: hypothetical protein JM58_16410 [Peptococcaceae bacterium BICA1-8]|nr:MAG: hypothetical protein JM58_16410 [Peptococcaceae bacterium BICA1-8]
MRSVDCGRRIVKGFNGSDEPIIFPAKVGEYRKLKLENKNQKWKVEISNIGRYFVGDLAEKESYCDISNTEESKIHLETKILTLSALALIGGHGPVITSLPIDQFDQADDLAKLLKGIYTVKLNEEVKPVLIADITFVPESVGIFYNEAIQENGLDVALEGKIRVIDIGSKTINYLTMEDYQYIAKESGTLQDLGCIQFDNANVEKEIYLKKAKSELIKRVPGWKESDIILCGGGGALKFRNELQKVFPLIRIVKNSVTANVIGNYKVVKLWQSESGK